jgi:Outer membrane protein beta-barrel domain
LVNGFKNIFIFKPFIMKKLFILALAATGLTSAKAQIQFGVKAGLNIATLSLSSDLSGSESLKSKTDFNAGVLASIPLFKSFTLQPEINYSGQGAKGSDGTTTTTLNYDYINVPVLFKYNHSSGLFAETGPQIGFLIGANAKADSQSEDIKNETSSTDFSWCFGLGYKIPEMNLGIDIRYNLGLSNTIKSSDEGTSKNSVFQFGIFYLFGH